MKLYVIRHSIRETPDDLIEAEDGDPQADLTPEGEELATALGEWMAEHEEIPSVLLVSPTVRAEQTAKLIAAAIEDAGFAAPEIKTDVGIGPGQSIRALALKLAGDDEKKGVGIVSHRAPIVNGLKALDVDNSEQRKVDDPAMGEMRVLKIKRKNGAWEEKRRVRPSDHVKGFPDTY